VILLVLMAAPGFAVQAPQPLAFAMSALPRKIQPDQKEFHD